MTKRRYSLEEIIKSNAQSRASSHNASPRENVLQARQIDRNLIADLHSH